MCPPTCSGAVAAPDQPRPKMVPDDAENANGADA